MLSSLSTEDQLRGTIGEQRAPDETPLRAHNPKVVGSNPTPATNAMSQDICKARTPKGSGLAIF